MVISRPYAMLLPRRSICYFAAMLLPIDADMPPPVTPCLPLHAYEHAPLFALYTRAMRYLLMLHAVIVTLLMPPPLDADVCQRRYASHER